MPEEEKDERAVEDTDVEAEEEKDEQASVIQVLFVVVILCGTLLAAHVRIIYGEEGGTKALAAGAVCIAVSVLLALGLWKVSQRARGIAVLFLLALLLYAVNAVWNAFLVEEAAPASAKVMSGLLALSTLAGLVLILHPKVRRTFVGDIAEMARTRQTRGEIWGLEGEIRRRKEEGRE